MNQSEIKSMSLKDLEVELAQAKSRYNNLKMTHRLTALEKPSELTKLRKTIARMATEISFKRNHI